jgi:predicted MFS family arabinose efflux permease
MTIAAVQTNSTFTRRRSWGAVVLLMLIGVVNVIDRLLPGVLAEPIKHDLHLSDTAFGLINGFGFLVVYALLGVPIARLSDRGAYGRVISICLALWSFMTLLGAAARAGWQLSLTRMGVALGEAGVSPASHAFIARNFPPTGRAAPLAVLTLSVPFASLLALFAGGLLGEAIGWRWTFVVMGAIGLILSPFALLTLGARQAAASAGPQASLSLRPALVLLKKPSFLITLIATSFTGIGGYTLATFSSAFLMRVHGMSLSEVGVKYGLAVGASGVVSVLTAGIMADRLSKRDPRWTLWVVALMIAMLLPFSYAAFLVTNPWTALVFMALANILASAYQAPVIAAVQRLAPTELRATASAFLLMFTALAGGAGPFLAGVISDALQADLGARSLGRAMLVVPVAQTIAGILYGVATIWFRRDMVADDAPDVTRAGEP